MNINIFQIIVVGDVIKVSQEGKYMTLRKGGGRP